MDTQRLRQLRCNIDLVRKSGVSERSVQKRIAVHIQLQPLAAYEVFRMVDHTVVAGIVSLVHPAPLVVRIKA